MSEIELKLAELDKGQLVDLVQKLAASVAKRYRADVLAEIDTNMETLLLEFRDHVVYRSWLAAQQWCRWENERFVLFPDYTRLYYRKGKREILVQEYPPQVRLMSFKERLAKCESADEAMHVSVLTEETFTYSLALPYTVFIFKFDDGLFQEVCLGFCDRPLKDCNEPVFRPYLSNLSSDLKVCLGRQVDHTKLIQGNVSQQAAYILSHFWQTTYSDEWSKHYWDNKHYFEATDPRLASLDAWQEASIDNPLFVIEDVQWLPHNEPKFGDIILRLFENEPTDAQFGQAVYEEIYQMFESTIKKTITDQLDVVDAKLSASVVNKLVEEMAVLVGAKIGN